MSAKKISKSIARRRPSSGARRRSPVAEVLHAVERVAARLGVRWYLFGAQAVLLYGVIRTTADVDVTAEIPASRVPAFVRAMETAGFELRVKDDPSFVKQTRVLPFAHAKTKLPLDVVLAGPGLEESFLDAVRRVDIAGARIPVIAPEDLIATKVLAGRPKDMEDVRGLLRHCEPLDLARVRQVLEAVEAALGQSDLTPAFERLVRSAKKAGPRRGSGRKRSPSTSRK